MQEQRLRSVRPYMWELSADNWSTCPGDSLATHTGFGEVVTTTEACQELGLSILCLPSGPWPAKCQSIGARVNPLCQHYLRLCSLSFLFIEH